MGSLDVYRKLRPLFHRQTSGCEENRAGLSFLDSNQHKPQHIGIATQLLVWETVVGERDSQFNHVDANAQGKNNIAEYTSPENPLYSEIFSQYSAIESAVKRHTMLPSFFSSTADAGAYELKWDGQQYSLTLTDTNGVLGDYTFTSNITGLNFSVDGNQLTITSSQAIKGSVTVKAEKISAQRSGVVVWTDGIIGGGKQDFATYGETVSDYMVGYLNLEVKTGNMKLVKTSEDGQVAGISFTITGEGYSATKTTNEAGEIDISDLNPGVYTVTEQSIDKYEPQESQRVTIVSGQTATVTFSNVLKRGSLEVTKTSEDGLVEGMTFHLYGTSLSGQPVDEYAVTDGNGVARFENVLIGTGYVLEEVDTPMEPPYEVVVYHHFENGFDERLDYQTLAEAEQAAQKYVAGTMEGEDGFAYDGAGIYDLQENRWLRVYGNFPDERAIEQAKQAPAAEEPSASPEQADLQPKKEEALPLPPKHPRRERITFTTLHPEVPRDQRHDFHITDDALGHGTPSEKYAANAAAIRTLKQIEAEERLATPEEQEILSRYVGWGGLANCFEQTSPHYEELKSLLDSEEYAAARASSLTAFYTPPVVIRGIYKALAQMGFTQGNILEPSCGTGNFLGLLPTDLAGSKAYGVELDSISGRIAGQLYQNANISVNGFETVQMPDSFFDVAVGNVPFGDFKVLDKRYDKHHWLIHDYFFGKTLDKVRLGGIVAFIASKGTLDKENSSVRKYLAQRADLIGAIRLPDNTFKRNAGTEVTSDIIFLQKRDHITDLDQDWVHLDTDENGIRMNRYFVQHPEMILGDMVMEPKKKSRYVHPAHHPAPCGCHQCGYSQ